MRRRVLGAVVATGAVLALPAGAIAQNAGVHVSVGPRTIGTHTNVLVRFRQPLTTGENGDEQSVEALQVSGPSRPDCIGSRRVVLAAAKEGTMMRHRLRPHYLGGRWCTGTYHGRLTYQIVPTCPSPGPVKAKVVACPMFVMPARTLGTFDFHVTAR